MSWPTRAEVRAWGAQAVAERNEEGIAALAEWEAGLAYPSLDTTYVDLAVAVANAIGRNLRVVTAANGATNVTNIGGRPRKKLKTDPERLRAARSSRTSARHRARKQGLSEEEAQKVALSAYRRSLVKDRDRAPNGQWLPL